jgi:hypothetical protein
MPASKIAIKKKRIIDKKIDEIKITSKRSANLLTVSWFIILIPFSQRFFFIKYKSKRDTTSFFGQCQGNPPICWIAVGGYVPVFSMGFQNF